MRFDLESTKILNLTPYSLEQSQSPTFFLVVQDRGVARLHLLVAILSLSGVVVAAVLLPTVYVAVLFPDQGIGENKNIGCQTRRSNSALCPSTVPLVQHLSPNLVTRT